MFLAIPGFQDAQRVAQAAQKKAAPRAKSAVTEVTPGLEPKAIDLLKSMASEAERERVAVYMDGLSQMRSEWKAQKGMQKGKRQKEKGKTPRGRRQPG